MTDSTARLRIDSSDHLGARVCAPVGVLDVSTYALLRDTLLKAAVEQPSAVLVDLADLSVPAAYSLTVFSTVWMRVSHWPGVPIGLVVEEPTRRRTLAGSAMARFVPVYASVEEGTRATGLPPHRRRATMSLVHDATSARSAREFVRRTCVDWGIEPVADIATVAVTELVENAIVHADGPDELRLELRPRMLTIAVSDGDPRPAVLRERIDQDAAGLGLDMVASMSTMWGCTPSYRGKVVWTTLQVDR